LTSERALARRAKSIPNTIHNAVRSTGVYVKMTLYIIYYCDTYLSMAPRVPHARPCNAYSNKVLIGNWFDERVNAVPRVLQVEIPTTLYTELYDCKPYSKVPIDAVWDQRMDREVPNRSKSTRKLQFSSREELYFHKTSASPPISSTTTPAPTICPTTIFPNATIVIFPGF
jgi:hypothetical protein